MPRDQEVAPRKIDSLGKARISIDNAPQMVNNLSRNLLFLLCYFPPEPSRVSHTLTPTRSF
jgi:hypothetical protein